MSLNTTVPADMHTHRQGQGEYYLLSCNDCNAAKFTSYQFHPWNQPETFVPFDNSFAESLKGYSALGEIGLDRLRGPELNIQRRYLDALLEVASAANLPVVIHNVRCDAELFSALKGFASNVLIHGFRGGAKALEKYLEHGWFVSFCDISNASMLEYLKSQGLNNTGIESDDSSESISEIAAKIAQKTDADVFSNSITTFRKFFKI